ncbi:MAG: DUF6454 family protein [Rhodococcus sp. (in: high G+C Gram-positive bacteria)]
MDTRDASGQVAAADAVFRAGRAARWELVRRTPLAFPTHHPQGLAFVGDRIFLSSVEILENPERLPGAPWATAGRGIGHVFVLDDQGGFLHDIVVGERDCYHPGGIDFDGTSIWVPVAEYRPRSRALVLSIDPDTLVATERFRIADHVGWIVADPDNGRLYGGSWGSREFVTWGPAGEELDRWENPSAFVDYQDAQYAGGGRVFCTGIATLPTPIDDATAELGGFALVDFGDQRIVREMPIPLFSTAQHVATRNPFALTVDSGELVMHVAPDDDTASTGTELLSYRATS